MNAKKKPPPYKRKPHTQLRLDLADFRRLQQLAELHNRSAPKQNAQLIRDAHAAAGLPPPDGK